MPRPYHIMASVSSSAEISPDDETVSDRSSVDSDGGGIETLVEKLTKLMNEENVISIRQEQLKMMNDLELANWKLASVNEISETTFNNCAADFKQYTKMLLDMKKQLDSIFRRIRTLKLKAASMYPEAYRLAEEKMAKKEESDSIPE